MHGLQIWLFFLLSAGMTYFCRHQLLNPRCHGFYRFFAFECILLLVILNASVWTQNLTSPLQLVSWTLLALSIYCVIQGLHLIKRHGGQHARSDSPENFGFENTTALVTTGIFKYVRHPMYTSLILLAWGALFKHISVTGMVLASAATGLMIITAKIEEIENRQFFGDSYGDYQRSSAMFIPFLL